MIAISSPRFDAPQEIIQNQVAALNTWEQEFEMVFLVIENDKPLEIISPVDAKVRFLTTSEVPTIQSLCKLCASFQGWSAIINSDIVIGPNWRVVERELLRSKVVCAISKRWELPSDRNLDNAQVVDLGLDFFAATPAVWAAAAREVPEVFRLGKIMWDTWMLGFFMHVSRGNCADITPAKVVFHPKHGSRGAQQIDPPEMKYRPMWPAFKIGTGWTARLGERKPMPMAAGGGGGAEMPI